MVGPSRPQFVLFGSSIVQLSFSHGGWGSILSDIYPRKMHMASFLRLASSLGLSFSIKQVFPQNCIQKGRYSIARLQWVYSRRALQVLDQVFPKDALVQPSLVVVYFGGNDSMGPHSSGLGPHVPLSEYVDNMRKIASHLRSLSDKTRIVFLSSPPLNEAKLRGNASGVFSEVVRTNDLCKKYSDACVELCQGMGMAVVDLFSAIQKRDDWENTCFTDGVHLSEEGSKVAVEEILKVIKKANWNPCLHWKSIPAEFSDDSPYDLVAADGKTTLNVSEWTFHREIQWD